MDGKLRNSKRNVHIMENNRIFSNILHFFFFCWKNADQELGCVAYSHTNTDEIAVFHYDDDDLATVLE
jgi:hypothetical protein